MSALFYGGGAVALLATALAISRAHPVHALLYFITSLLAVAVVLFSLGAPFAAALEVLVYAGAIMVLFVFVVMLLNLGPTVDSERAYLQLRYWLGPGLLAGVLATQFVLAVADQAGAVGGAEVSAKQVGIAMFGPYLLAVELASMLLLAGLVAAFHIGKGREP